MADKMLAEWFWVDRWVGSSAFGLNIAARGLYREMLSQAWRRGGALPNDHDQIRRICAVTRAEWKRTWPFVERFWRVEGDTLVNDTQLEVYAEARLRADKTRTRAVAGAEGRWSHKSDGKSRQERIEKARAIATHTKEQWQALVAFCGGRCLCCGSVGPITKDHVVPVSSGGSDGIDNLQPLCTACNSGKSGNADYRTSVAGFEEFLNDILAEASKAQAMPKQSVRSTHAMPSDLRSPVSDLPPLKSSGGAPSPNARSKHPAFRGQRVVMFDWQLADLLGLLGPHAEGFAFDEWLDALDKRCLAEDIVPPVRDGGVWLRAELLAEAKRRGLPLREVSAPNARPTPADEDAMWAAVAKAGPSRRPYDRP